jgi:transcriptional regulator with XRE-family HTH domain
MSDPKKELAEKIRSARADKGWKQKELAAQVDVEPMTVSRWERGATTPDLDVIRLLAEATDKPMSYFVGGESRPSSDDRVDGLEHRLGRIEAQLAELLARLPG